MKLTRYCILSLALLMFFSHSAKQQDYQHSHNFAQEIGRTTIDFLSPITFNSEGITHFFTHVYNHSDYGSDFLPNNFSHLLQFLQHGQNTRQGASYAQSVLKLFGNKLKSAPYISAYAFSAMLGSLQELLKHYFTPPKPTSLVTLKTNVSDVLYSTFLSQFDAFKKNPKTFFNNLSNEIISSLNHELRSAEKKLKKEQLRQSVVRFLELCTGKLIWSPQEPSDIMPSLSTVSKQLAKMMNNHIIQDIDHLDDLFWSLTHRFCFFIELTGEQLPIAFYQNSKQDLLRKNLLLCSLEEQEKLITSKADRLMNALLTGEAKARAQEKGILVY